METKLKELAELVNGKVQGDGETPIRGVAGMREAALGDITFLANPKYLSLVRHTNASAVIVADGAEAGTKKPMIAVPNPDLVIPLTADAQGDLTLVVTWPQGVPSAVSLYTQFWVQDASGPAGFTASNAVESTTP